MSISESELVYKAAAIYHREGTVEQVDEEAYTLEKNKDKIMRQKKTRLNDAERKYRKEIAKKRTYVEMTKTIKEMLKNGAKINKIKMKINYYKFNTNQKQIADKLLDSQHHLF